MYGDRGDVAFGWGEDKAAAANKTPIAQANKWGDRWGKHVIKETGQQWHTKRRSQQTSGETRKKE